jgi:hypothetical protein
MSLSINNVKRKIKKVLILIDKFQFEEGLL